MLFVPTDVGNNGATLKQIHALTTNPQQRSRNKQQMGVLPPYLKKSHFGQNLDQTLEI